MSKRPLIFLWAAVIVVTAAAAFYIVVGASRDVSIDLVDGVWIGLASDLEHGMFYRPVIDGDATGGTRYMPLYFSLLALLMRLGLPPVGAGYLISVVSLVGLLAGLYRLERRLGVSRTLAAPFAAGAILCFAILDASISVKGDMLAATLNVWGLVFCIVDTERKRRPDIALAALCFVLAFSVKLTTLFGFAAGVAYLLLARRKRAAAGLAALTVVGMVAVVALVVFVSDGRFIDLMRACASGGLSADDLLRGPVWFVEMLLRDPGAGALVLLAGAVVLATSWRQWRELPVLAFALTLAASFVIALSPGTDANHLIDLYVISFAVLGVAVSRVRVTPAVVACFVGIFALLAAGSFTMLAVRHLDDDEPECRRAVVDLIRNARRPVLCTSALPPVLAGKRPDVLDPFSLRLIFRDHPEVASRMRERLASQEFEAVILVDDPRTEEGMKAIRLWNMGGEFLDWLDPYYQLTEEHGKYLIYRPRAVPTGGGESP